MVTYLTKIYIVPLQYDKNKASNKQCALRIWSRSIHYDHFGEAG